MTMAKRMCWISSSCFPHPPTLACFLSCPFAVPFAPIQRSLWPNVSGDKLPWQDTPTFVYASRGSSCATRSCIAFFSFVVAPSPHKRYSLWSFAAFIIDFAKRPSTANRCSRGCDLRYSLTAGGRVTEKKTIRLAYQRWRAHLRSPSRWRSSESSRITGIKT